GADMHPPPFRIDHRLSDWSRCGLELHCCTGKTVLPPRVPIDPNSDPTFAESLAACGANDASGRLFRSISAPATARAALVA
ncbi:MAG: hypothetical protein P4L90_00450, partial [Rhodopila sp.]|nr:hypothetical protein [Rhodopila sp.]